jgi:transcriptional regulator with XRE-family HTH domain
MSLRQVQHISMAHLSEVERGRKEASSVMLETIAKSFHISTADLLKEVYKELERGSKWESKTL